MWYVIQVYSGQEDQTKELIEKYVCKKNIEDCKIPLYVKAKKRKECWNMETRTLFPGYIFIKTRNIMELYYQLKSVPGMTRLLGTGKEIVPVSAEEEIFLYKVGGQDLIVGLSKGIIENGKLIILSGPLKDMEDYIKKINRHKRLAWIELNILGETREMLLGLEVFRVS